MKKELTEEQKKLDIDLWIIIIATALVYVIYACAGSKIMAFCKDSSNSVWLRLLISAALEFGIAGLGITLVCIFRKKSFTSFGLKKDKTLRTIACTVLCFVPYIIYIFVSGQFKGYEPFSVMVTPDLHAAGIIATIIGTLVIAIVWGFFEGFNYAVIRNIIDKRYNIGNKLFSIGALVCTIMGIMFHPIHFDLLGIIDLITTFIALYGMLMIQKHNDNSWGCVFAFMFIWNAF